MYFDKASLSFSKHRGRHFDNLQIFPMRFIDRKNEKEPVEKILIYH